MGKTGGKPKIRILHHLARSGGTLISKCLGSMKDVVLFSEVHPDAMKFINPVQQAIEWHGLVSKAEARAWRMKDAALFVQMCVLAEYRASTRGAKVVLRDWSHIDYHGLPYQRPTMRSRIVEVLKDRFEIVQTSTVRHPIDTYLSLMKLPIMQNIPFSIKMYLDGCLAFAEYAVQTGFLRYEDFTHAPDEHLRTLCERLELEFDPGYAQRWQTYEHITGDITGTRGGKSEIRPLKRRPADAQLVAQFRSYDSYAKIKELLGYDED